MNEIKEIDGIKLQFHQSLLLSGLMKNHIFLNYQNGKNHYWNIIKIIQILFNQNEERMKLLVL